MCIWKQKQLCCDIATTVVFAHYSAGRLLQRSTISTLVAKIQMFKTKSLPPFVSLSVTMTAQNSIDPSSSYEVSGKASHKLVKKSAFSCCGKIKESSAKRRKLGLQILTINSPINR